LWLVFYLFDKTIIKRKWRIIKPMKRIIVPTKVLLMEYVGRKTARRLLNQVADLFFPKSTLS